jgi:uncharacterized phage protein (TIGR01671 family)
MSDQNRVIMFRAWDKGHNKMSYKVNLYSLNHRGEMDKAQIDNKQVMNRIGFDCEIMQSTGIVDRNGKDIYESDIVKFHYFYQVLGAGYGVAEAEHELIGVLEWGTFGWRLKEIKGEHWRGHTGYDDGEGESSLLELCQLNEGQTHEESFEVIGNIHEHPSLLNPQTPSK